MKGKGERERHIVAPMLFPLFPGMASWLSKSGAAA